MSERFSSESSTALDRLHLNQTTNTRNPVPTPAFGWFPSPSLFDSFSRGISILDINISGGEKRLKAPPVLLESVLCKSIYGNKQHIYLVCLLLAGGEVRPAVANWLRPVLCEPPVFPNLNDSSALTGRRATPFCAGSKEKSLWHEIFSKHFTNLFNSSALDEWAVSMEIYFPVTNHISPFFLCVYIYVIWLLTCNFKIKFLFLTVEALCKACF